MSLIEAETIGKKRDVIRKKNGVLLKKWKALDLSKRKMSLELWGFVAYHLW